METNRWDSEGNYHDDEVRLESYAEVADIPKKETDPIFVERVVDKIQLEVGQELAMNPAMTINEIKMAALRRLMDLLLKELLTQDEADKIYARFSRMVNHYYGF